MSGLSPTTVPSCGETWCSHCDTRIPEGQPALVSDCQRHGYCSEHCRSRHNPTPPLPSGYFEPWQWE